MSKHPEITRLFTDARTNPELARHLGRAQSRIDDVVGVARQLGYNFTKADYIAHMMTSFSKEVGKLHEKKKTHHATTFATGEEDNMPRDDRPFTDAIPEEIQPKKPTATTFAMGEEDKKPRTPPKMPKKPAAPITTAAVGEEGKKR